MSTRISELTDQMEKTREQLRVLAANVDEENRQWSDTERDEAKKHLEQLENLKGQLERASSEVQLRDQIHQMLDVTPPPGGNGHKADDAPAGTLGERFTESAQFRAWLKAIAPEGRIADSTKGLVSPPYSFRGFKDIITGADAGSGGAFVTPTQAALVPLPARQLTIRDIITVGRTTSDTIEYVRVDTTTNAAAPTAEATGPAPTGGDKPESAMTFVRETATVSTIAHWMPVTKRALADAAQIRSLVDAFLRQGLEEALEDQIISGDGVGENFTGIANTSGTQAQAWDTDLLTTTRKGRTKVTVVARATPTAYLLHPNDWEAIDLLQDNENRYYFGGPANLGVPRLWGLPVVVSEALTEGVGYVGDFRTAVLWDREQASIQVSDSHSDFFTRNIVAILAEMRAGFGVLRPDAIVELDLTAV